MEASDARPKVMVDLGGYVIILVETKDKKIKLYGNYLSLISRWLSVVLHGVTRGTRSQSGASRGSLEPSRGFQGLPRGIQGHPGTSRDIQGHLGATRGNQGLPGASRDI